MSRQRCATTVMTSSFPTSTAAGLSPPLEHGLALKDVVGWDAIQSRARDALRGLPEDTVLAGVSMRAGVVSEVWASSIRPPRRRRRRRAGRQQLPEQGHRRARSLLLGQ
jgi:hypothetical protein